MLAPIVYLPSLNLPKIPMHSQSALSFLAKALTTWIVCIDEWDSTRLRQQQLDSTVFLKVWSKHWPASYCSAMNWLESPFYPSKICWIVNFSFQTVKYTFSAPSWIWRLGYLVTRRGCLVCACAKKSFFVTAKMAEAEGMDVDPPALPSTSSGSAKKRFEVKKVRTFCHHLYLLQATFWRFYSS